MFDIICYVQYLDIYGTQNNGIQYSGTYIVYGISVDQPDIGIPIWPSAVWEFTCSYNTFFDGSRLGSDRNTILILYI